MIGSIKGSWPFWATPEGGLARQVINKTGAASVKGNIVRPHNTVANGVKLTAQNIPDVIGVIYNDGVPDGSLVWMVFTGAAEVYFITDVVMDNLARGFLTADAGFAAGQAMSEAFPTSPFSDDKHFYEIGHTIESRTGAGLAKTNIHFL